MRIGRLKTRSVGKHIVAFYRGDGRDHRGRSLSDIHAFDFHELEFNHDYIQWLFPLPEPSGANARRRLLSKEDIAADSNPTSRCESVCCSLSA